MIPSLVNTHWRLEFGLLLADDELCLGKQGLLPSNVPDGIRCGGNGLGVQPATLELNMKSVMG